MYRNDSYMTIHDTVKNIKLKWPDENPVNPFPTGFTVFDYITVGGSRVNTYGLDINCLWSIYSQLYTRLAIAKKVPRIGYQYTWRNDVYTIADVGDQARYVWQWLSDSVGWYCQSNRNRWAHLLYADIQQYDPITNYNMTEYAGSSSKASGMTSTPGTLTNETYVYPYDTNTGTGKPESRTVSTPTSSTSSYTNDTQEYTDTNNPWANDIKTPRGNVTSVSKLTRKGNIGVTTSQQMIASEYELRKHNVMQDFMNEVAKYSLILDWDSALNDTY